LGATNLLATSRLRTQRAAVYVADGATEGAIQFLRQSNNANCGRPIGGSCSLTQFQYTDPQGNAATTTWQFAGTGFDYDRTLQLTTRVGGVPRVTAKVIFRDSIPKSGGVPVDVVDWTYKR
jgi:hypothetical protein